MVRRRLFDNGRKTLRWRTEPWGRWDGDSGTIATRRIPGSEMFQDFKSRRDADERQPVDGAHWRGGASWCRCRIRSVPTCYLTGAGPAAGVKQAGAEFHSSASQTSGLLSKFQIVPAGLATVGGGGLWSFGGWALAVHTFPRETTLQPKLRTADYEYLTECSALLDRDIIWRLHGWR